MQRCSLRRGSHLLFQSLASAKSPPPSRLRCRMQRVPVDPSWEADTQSYRRFLSGWTGVRGHDITGESLDWGDRPKVILLSYAPSGFDVQNTVKKVDNAEESDGVVHMNGSILVFPFGCFLWKVESAVDVTLASLAPILLHRPKLDYLFIGCNGTIPAAELDVIQSAFRSHNIVVEQMTLSNAVGTFNILNAEDRQVAAALVMAADDDNPWD